MGSLKGRILSLFICVSIIFLQLPNLNAAQAAGAGIVSFSPTNNSQDVSTIANLEINFDSEPTAVASKYIHIRLLSDNSLVESIEATSTAVTITGYRAIINPTSNFNQDTEYYIELDTGAFKENSVDVAGWTGSGTWSFSTVKWSEVSTDGASLKIDGGLAHTIAVNSSGDVIAWGDNSSGQTTVPDGLFNVISVSAGDNFSVAVNADGTVVAWGDNSAGQTSVPVGLTGVTKVSSYGTHTIALNANGTFVWWGTQDGSSSLTGTFEDVSAGGWQTYGVTSSDTLDMMGNPATLAGTHFPNVLNVSKVDIGLNHSIALKNDNTIEVWGKDDSFNQLANTPIITDAISVAAGDSHNAVLRQNGTVTAWGRDLEGQCSGVSGWTDIIEIAAGNNHTIGVKSDGTIVSTDSATYTIPVGYKMFGDTGAQLSALSTSVGTLSPVFDSETRDYYIEVSSLLTSLTVTPTSADSAATIKVNGEDVISGSASGDITLTSNTDTITIAVTDSGGLATRYYSIEVRKLSDNSLLSDLKLDGTSVSGFDPAVTTYNETVLNSTVSVVVTGVSDDPAASVLVTGPATLTLGTNVYIITVTAQDSSTRDYTLNVLKPNNDATLSDLAIDSTTVTGFASSTYTYEVDVAYVTDEVTVSATTNDSNAGAIITGPNSPSTLSLGANVFTIDVTAEDSSTQEYTLTINRQNNDATLSDLAIDSTTVTGFASGTYTYEVDVANATDEVTVSATTNDSNAGAIITGPNSPSTLSLGANVFTINVTAEDGSTQEYTLTINRQNNDATLSDLAIDSTTVTGFASGTYTYEVDVAYATDEVTVSATTNDSNAGAVITGPNSPSTLSLGANVFTIDVTAEDGSTQEYTLTINRLNNDADLSSILIDGIPLDGFNADVLTYDYKVSNSTTSIVVSAAASDSNAAISGVGSHALAEGYNFIYITVTSEDATVTKTYTLRVRRVLTDATLSDLSIDGQTVLGFDSNTMEYSLTVAGDVSSILIGAVATQDGFATIAGDGAKTLALEDNVFDIVVTAEDEVTTKTYRLNIRRGDENSKLSDLTIDSLTVTGFNPLITDYNVIVSSDTDRVNIDAAAQDLGATIAGRGFVDLEFGDNVISLIVTSEDGLVSTRYTISIYRQSDDATLSNLKVNGLRVSGFNSQRNNYDIYLEPGETKATIEAFKNDPNASVSGAGEYEFDIGETIVRITVTAQDTQVVNTYLLTFIVSPAPSPVIESVSPSSGAVDIDGNTNLEIVFDLSVIAAQGNITIYNKSNSSVFKTISVLGSSVVINGNRVTIDIDAKFEDNQEYYVLIQPGAFESLIGGVFAGISNNTEWTFTISDKTAPKVVNRYPSSNASNISLKTTLSITFDEEVTGTDAYLVIRKVEGKGLQEAIECNSLKVDISSDTAQITLQNDLEYGTEYYVTIEQGAFIDLAGNSSNAIGGESWSFNTEPDPNPNSQDEPEPEKEPVKKQEPELSFKLTVKLIDQNGDPVFGAKVELHSDVKKVATGKDGKATFSDFELGRHKLILRAWSGEVVKEYDLDINIKTDSKQMEQINGVYVITLTPRNVVTIFNVDLTNEDVLQLTEGSPVLLLDKEEPTVDSDGRLSIKIPDGVNIKSISSGNANTSIVDGKILIDYDEATLAAQGIEYLIISFELEDNTIYEKTILISSTKFSIAAWYNDFDDWQKILLSGTLLVLIAMIILAIVLIKGREKKEVYEAS